jgi:uncharacterized 2Fe-2S/4Fe-4S cluster protein (DUF4445 family)
MECQCTIAIAKNSFFVYHCSRTRKGGIAVPIITLPENNKKLSAAAGTTLLDALKENGLYPDAPCGGNGTCGKCTLLVNGTQVLACRTVVDRDMTVVLPQAENRILQERFCAAQSIDPLRDGYLLAFDIGTTSVVCSLLDGKTGAELAQSSMLNPQVAYGADVITRIQQAVRGKLALLTQLIRHAITDLTQAVCDDAGICSVCIGPEKPGAADPAVFADCLQYSGGYCPG